MDFEVTIIYFNSKVGELRRFKEAERRQFPFLPTFPHTYLCRGRGKGCTPLSTTAPSPFLVTIAKLSPPSSPDISVSSNEILGVDFE
jgi:hypothetical protein